MEGRKNDPHYIFLSFIFLPLLLFKSSYSFAQTGFAFLMEGLKRQ